MPTHSVSGVHSVSAGLVLIVEDDEDSAELFACWFRDAGLGVVIVSDADEALAFAPVLRPAVVVVDLGLPTTDGIALVHTLRETSQLTSEYVAVTAFAGARLPALCQAAGFRAFFQKPVAGPALVDCVLTMLNSGARARAR